MQGENSKGIVNVLLNPNVKKLIVRCKLIGASITDKGLECDVIAMQIDDELTPLAILTNNDLNQIIEPLGENNYTIIE